MPHGEVLVSGIARSGQDWIDRAGADPARDDATVDVITEVAFSYDCQSLVHDKRGMDTHL